MKRRLFLHLGLSKTGTTSIQSFLRGNRGVLAAHGVSYPDIADGHSAHPALAPSVLRPNAGREANHVALAMEIKREKGASSTQETHTPLWSGVFERIEAGGAHTVIISYENFYSNPELYSFDCLASQLQHFDVRGIIYLRPQEDWFLSLYAQSIRGTARMAASLAHFTKSRGADLKYSVMLDNISAHIPLDHLIVGDFEKASASGLLTDFMEKVGLSRDIPLPLDDQTLTNLSLPYWSTLFLLKCNQARIPDEAFVKVRQALTRSMTPDDIPRLRPGLDVATPEEREGLRAAAAADADRLEERYGITLGQRAREPVAYRPFDDEDVDSIRKALTAKIPRSAREALDGI